MDLFNCWGIFLVCFLRSCWLLSLLTPVIVCYQWWFALRACNVSSSTHLPGTSWKHVLNLYVEFQVCYLAPTNEKTEDLAWCLILLKTKQMKNTSRCWHRDFSYRKIPRKYWGVTFAFFSCKTFIKTIFFTEFLRKSHLYWRGVLTKTVYQRETGNGF